MLRVNHAILHVCDFESCVNVFSEEELDLSDRKVKSYVGKTCRKALSSVENRRGEFEPDSSFEGEVRDYFANQVDFVSLSRQCAQFIAEELGHMESSESCDVLVADFEDDAPKVSTDTPEEDQEAAYEAQGKRYFVVALLNSRPAFMHEVGGGELGTRVDIARHHAILPNPSQKLSSYALVESKTLEVLFCDKEREISGEKRLLLPEGLLQCSSEASSKEVVDTVTRIVEEVAQEFGANTAVAASKAKAYVNENADDSAYLAPWDMAEEVFDDEPMQKRFEEAVAAENLPDKVPMEKKAAQRLARNHKIRTDTGIEITFPTEYSHNPDFIEFVSMPNGMISIELKNIGNIENR